MRVLEKHYEGKLDWFRKARNPEDGTNPPMAIAIYGIDPFWIPSDYYRAFRDEAHGSTGKWKEWMSKHQDHPHRPKEPNGRKEAVFF